MKLIRNFFILTVFIIGIATGLKAQINSENKVYRVTAIKNGDNSITSTSNYAEIIPPLHLYIPSAFTPNGDGLNDTFGIKGEGIKDYHLFIYDRWGEIIFESTNLRQQWDGKCNGKPAEQGTYVYQLFALGTGAKGRSGSVTLVY
jgi:gliding motility-associated-like protein